MVVSPNTIVSAKELMIPSSIEGGGPQETAVSVRGWWAISQKINPPNYRPNSLSYIRSSKIGPVMTELPLKHNQLGQWKCKNHYQWKEGTHRRQLWSSYSVSIVGFLRANTLLLTFTSCSWPIPSPVTLTSPSDPSIKSAASVTAVGSHSTYRSTFFRSPVIKDYCICWWW